MKFTSLALASFASLVLADDIPSCGAGMDACPEDYPCCSIDGTCGNGYVCLGGCDPRYSNTPGSCMPMPQCVSKSYSLSEDLLTNYTSYRGDASKEPFIYTGDVRESNGKLQAYISEASPASTITLNTYIWYGKVTLTMKSSHGSGIISDFILISDAKDEIDFEMVGSKTTQAQTNYYWDGVLDYDNMVAATVADVYENTLEYTIDWQEDKIDWIVNGTTVRTLNKSDTKNSTTGEYMFPQTPCRVQFGLWAAGDSPYEGTQEWAGGSVDWSDAGSDGYYVEVSTLDVDCYSAPSDSGSGDVSYVYTNADVQENDVSLSDNSTILLSLDGTGENPCGTQCNSSSSSSSSSASGATLGGSVAASSSSSGATLGGSLASTSTSSSSAAATLSGSASGSSSASGSDSDSSSSASGSGSASASASASASSSSEPTASASSAAASSGSSSSTGASSNGGAAAAVGVAVAAIAPIAFLL